MECLVFLVLNVRLLGGILYQDGFWCAHDVLELLAIIIVLSTVNASRLIIISVGHREEILTRFHGFDNLSDVPSFFGPLPILLGIRPLLFLTVLYSNSILLGIICQILAYRLNSIMIRFIARILSKCLLFVSIAATGRQNWQAAFIIAKFSKFRPIFPIQTRTLHGPGIFAIQIFIAVKI